MRFVFFFSSRRRHTRSLRDWSSDVCSSDLSGDQSADEQSLIGILDDAGVPFQNEKTSTEDTDLGYAASFGYRFNRYIAGELGLSQFGSLTSTLTADVDLPQDTSGFVPARFEYSFKVGGPVISVL